MLTIVYVIAVLGAGYITGDVVKEKTKAQVCLNTTDYQECSYADVKVIKAVKK